MNTSDTFPLVYHLPWPPSVNNYYVQTRYGKHISKKGRLFRLSARSSMHEQGIFQLIYEPVEMSVIMYPPDARKRDLDNYLKALQDSMSTDKKEPDWPGIYEDDKLIDQLKIYRGVKIAKGKVTVILQNAGFVLPDNVENLIIDGVL